MPVFDVDIERQIAPGASETETFFDYLNRADRIEAHRVRVLIEEWVSRYPESDRAALISRLRQRRDEGFVSAFWELALHEWLIRTGNTILAVEPTIPGVTTKPDFLAQASDGSQFYLEAVVVTGMSNADRASEKRMNDVRKAVGQVSTSRHNLTAQSWGAPTSQITLSKLKRELQEWCNALPDRESATGQKFVYKEHGLRLEISAFALREASADTPKRGSVSWIFGRSRTIGEDVFDALYDKAKKYGDLPAPFVIAVNNMEAISGLDDTIAALFGAPVATVTRHSDGSESISRAVTGEGLWGNNDGPKSTGVSAIVTTGKLTPWTVGQRGACLIRNPWASRPLPSLPIRLPQLNPNDEEELVRSEGETWREIFGLHEDWPEDEGSHPLAALRG